ncbi:uncharacterized protein K02A2.6-like [Trichonephila clavipes]|nr:uncharacterized protein K02A2.6-like [Trichonephila clavipes]
MGCELVTNNCRPSTSPRSWYHFLVWCPTGGYQSPQNVSQEIAILNGFDMKPKRSLNERPTSCTNESPTEEIPDMFNVRHIREISHLSKSCPNHSRGPRCFSYNLYGPKSFECRRANLNNTSTGCDVIKQAHLNISPTGVKFAQILRPSDNVNENFIMTISDDSPTFDIGPNVSQHNRAEVEQLISTYTPKKTKAVSIELDIALTDDESILHKPRRLPFAERDIVDAQVDEWVKNGNVEPCSSPCASQVVVVKKKDGKSRVCIDYRRLNRKLIKDYSLFARVN